MPDRRPRPAAKPVALERSATPPSRRVVERDGLRLEVLTTPAPARPAKRRAAAPLRVAPVELVEKMGRRLRRVFYVSPADVESGESWLAEPGWYVTTVNPPTGWLNNDPHGPYDTLEELRADATYADD